MPCYKLAVRFGDRSLPRRFAAAGRPGAYVRVLQEGELAAGDRLHVLSRPDQAVTVGLVATAYHSHDAQLTGAVLRAPGLPSSWYDWARARDHTPATSLGLDAPLVVDLVRRQPGPGDGPLG